MVELGLVVSSVCGGLGVLIVKNVGIVSESVLKKVCLILCAGVYLGSIYEWVGYMEQSEVVRMDGLSVYFVLLTTVLSLICIVSVWENERSVESMCLYLILEGFIIGVFVAWNVVYFYVCFESVLIPMYIIIGRYGGRERRVKAGNYLLVYTLVGSVLMLLGIIMLYLEVGSTNYDVVANSISKGIIGGVEEKILWMLFFVGMIVKVPMLPVHIWLPEAHVEAPTEGSVILAGILLKLGCYGLIRYNVCLFRESSEYFSEVVYVLALLGVVYTSLTAIRQTDMKRVIAYASVAHMSMTMLGLFSGVYEGVNGSILQMVCHGIVSGGLFLCVGVVYSRYHSRQIYYYSGLNWTMPVYSSILLLFTMANIGLPGTCTFVGEFLIIEGVFESNKFVALMGSSSMVLGGGYSLWLYNRVCNGNIRGGLVSGKDVIKRELSVLMPLMVLVILIGIYPNVCLGIFEEI